MIRSQPASGLPMTLVLHARVAINLKEIQT
jgi:hypothetical protein